MTELSAVDKLPKEDSTLQRLLDLNDEIYEVGKGYWVQIRAVRVPPTPSKPYGVDYSLCLFDCDGNRLVCYDNAHHVWVGRPPSRKKKATNDHRHTQSQRVPYEYSSAETLLEDFWADVERVLKEEGVP